MSLVSLILGWLPKTIITELASVGVEAYKVKVSGDNDKAKIEADLVSRQIALDQRQAELQAQIVISEQGNWFTRSIRPMWAAPFLIYDTILICDKIAGKFGYNWSTDPLDDRLWWLNMTIVIAYFGGRVFEKRR